MDHSLPHAGGDTPRDHTTIWQGSSVCPTQVGIHRAISYASSSRCGLPHAGGDTPIFDLLGDYLHRSAPRRWGYTDSTTRIVPKDSVCPTQVGIHLREGLHPTAAKSLPHAGGDTPYANNHYERGKGSAPRRWGYTFMCALHDCLSSVCPTQVGIHPIRAESLRGVRCLPHAGGDTPSLATCATFFNSSAPRRWGYTEQPVFVRLVHHVCPTQVGIHPA